MGDVAAAECGRAVLRALLLVRAACAAASPGTSCHLRVFPHLHQAAGDGPETLRVQQKRLDKTRRPPSNPQGATAAPGKDRQAASGTCASRKGLPQHGSCAWRSMYTCLKASRQMPCKQTSFQGSCALALVPCSRWATACAKAASVWNSTPSHWMPPAANGWSGAWWWEGDGTVGRPVGCTCGKTQECGWGGQWDTMRVGEG